MASRPILIQWRILIPALAVLGLLIWFIVGGFQGILANTEDADICERLGFVWLSGGGVSDPGCYDLERIPME